MFSIYFNFQKPFNYTPPPTETQPNMKTEVPLEPGLEAKRTPPAPRKLLYPHHLFQRLNY